MGFLKEKLNFQWSSLDTVSHSSNFKNYQKNTASKIIVYNVWPGKLLVNIVNYGKTVVTANLAWGRSGNEQKSQWLKKVARR